MAEWREEGRWGVLLGRVVDVGDLFSGNGRGAGEQRAVEKAGQGGMRNRPFWLFSAGEIDPPSAAKLGVGGWGRWEGWDL